MRQEPTLYAAEKPQSSSRHIFYLPSGIPAARSALRSSSITVAAGETHPNLSAKFFSTAACRSGMYEETASEMMVVR